MSSTGNMYAVYNYYCLALCFVIVLVETVVIFEKGRPNVGNVAYLARKWRLQRSVSLSYHLHHPLLDLIVPEVQCAIFVVDPFHLLSYVGLAL